MSLEKFENNELPVENASGERLETADAVEARLGQLGWTSEQIGNFASAIRMMADAMTRDGADGHAGNVSIELNVADSEETGVEEAEVTLMGEGKELGPDRLSELVSDPEFFEKVMDESDPEFFVNMNKVVLRRKKDRTSDGYRSIKEGPHHEV
jgi:hypothetical protein